MGWTGAASSRLQVVRLGSPPGQPCRSPTRRNAHAVLNCYLLVATAFAALCIWSYVPLAPGRFFVSPVVLGVFCAICDSRRNPVSIAAIAGALFVVVPVAAHWTYLWFGYPFYDHNQLRPYFEDGAIAEGLIYPVIYCVIYAPMASVIASLTSLLVSYGFRNKASLTLQSPKSND